MPPDYPAWLGKVRAGQPAERLSFVVNDATYLIASVVESPGLVRVATVRTIDFADALIREVCQQYLSGQYLEAALLYPPGLMPSDLGQRLELKPVEAGLLPVLMVEFPPGSHEALVECRFRFAVSDDNLLCDPLSGDSLGPLPGALERIGAAADAWVGGLVADMRRFVADRLGGVRTEGAEFGQCG